ncbi:MAG: DUF928 domain-containing protein [Nitrospirota bacterium]|nr:DUF928 domain-containing protein [Nitrospirota bacterium]MDH5585242.1 DUF928 domain-containing protein [Nitrospirota bacterium]MDH5773991.1 DUF928 domain-containing protein [Nitrospirota bacterium]
MNVKDIYRKHEKISLGKKLNHPLAFPSWPKIVSLILVSVVVCWSTPHALQAAAPNIVLNRAIHFPTVNGNPITLPPGKYLVEQAGPEELRVTAVADKQEFLIRAQALAHEQYELFSPMALTRYGKNHEFLMNLLLPGGIRLEATGSSKEFPKPTPGQGPPPIAPVAELPIPPVVPVLPVEPPPVAPIIPEPEPPALPQTVTIPDPPAPPAIIVEESPVIIYQAPAPDQPGLRIDGISSDSQYASVFALAPNHVGHTSQEHPVLYWYLSQATQHPLDVMIAEEGHLDVLLDIRLLPPLQAGIHELRLEDYGISLLPDVPYRWTVRMMASAISESPTASGAIKRIQAPAGSANSLIYSPEGYAQKGQWYDAISALQTLIQAKPGNTDLLTQQAALLEQVGLTEAAAFVQQANTP